MAAHAHKFEEHSHWSSGPALDASARDRYASLHPATMQDPMYNSSAHAQMPSQRSKMPFAFAAPSAMPQAVNDQALPSMTVTADQLAIAPSSVKPDADTAHGHGRGVNATIGIDPGMVGANLTASVGGKSVSLQLPSASLSVHKQGGQISSAPIQATVGEDAKRQLAAQQPQPGMHGMDHDAPAPGRGAMRSMLADGMDFVGSLIADPGGTMAGHYPTPTVGRTPSPLQARMNYWSHSAIPMMG